MDIKHVMVSVQLNTLIRVFLQVAVLLMCVSSAYATASMEEELALVKQSLLSIKFEQGVYQGHDDGERCDTEAVLPEITLIDKNKDRKEPISFCFKITNTSKVWLDNILLKGIKPELSHTDFLPMTNAVAEPLAPNASVMFYVEYLLEESILGQFIVEADMVDKEGEHFLMARSLQTAGIIKADLIVAPPIVHKTVLPKGGKGMFWTLELVNTSNRQELSVDVFDNLSENTVFEPLKAGHFISESGIYCKAMGQSYTEACYFESGGIGYPQGRIVWKGKIASDFARLAEDAENKVIIRFVSNAPESEIGDIITSQARSVWGVDQAEVLSDNPATQATPADPTTYKIHKPIEPEPEVIQIPTLSQWGTLLLSLLILALIRFKKLN